MTIRTAAPNLLSEAGRMRSRRRFAAVRRAIVPTTAMWVIAIVMAFPLLWFLLSSFKPGSELFSYPLSFFPRDWTLSGYVEAIESFDLLTYVSNSAIVATVTTVLTVIICCATGYALAAYKNRWTTMFGVLILAMIMLPSEVILNPTFLVVRDVGLYNSLLGVILPSVVNTTGILMFRQFFRQIPVELFDAARVDGASEFKIFFRIMMPLSRPIMLTLAIMSFQWRWNDYVLPLIILRDTDKFTLQIALQSLIGSENVDWSVLLPASVLSMIPLVVIYFIFQRYITSSNTSSGLKD